MCEQRAAQPLPDQVVHHVIIGRRIREVPQRIERRNAQEVVEQAEHRPAHERDALRARQELVGPGEPPPETRLGLVGDIGAAGGENALLGDGGQRVRGALMPKPHVGGYDPGANRPGGYAHRASRF